MAYYPRPKEALSWAEPESARARPGNTLRRFIDLACVAVVSAATTASVLVALHVGC